VKEEVQESKNDEKAAIFVVAVGKINNRAMGIA